MALRFPCPTPRTWRGKLSPRWRLLPPQSRRWSDPMGEFRMPSLGADMTEGTLVQWNVKPGDSVKRGDIVAIVGTEKADIEVEVYETGVIDRLIAKPGDKLPVGTPLAMIQVPGEAAAFVPPSEHAPLIPEARVRA